MKLHRACTAGDIEEVKRLIAEGADINECSHENDGGSVPLQVAIEGSYDGDVDVHLELVKFLIDGCFCIKVRKPPREWPIEGC